MSEPGTGTGSGAVDAAVGEARARYAARRPRTSELHARAQSFLPGGLLTFTAGPSPVNAPYDVLLAEYNDAAAAQALLREHAGTVACVLVEPMLGSGGCIPGDPVFLSVLRETTRQAGALLIFDEV